jgi:hypothetical protein
LSKSRISWTAESVIWEKSRKRGNEYHNRHFSKSGARVQGCKNWTQFAIQGESRNRMGNMEWRTWNSKKDRFEAFSKNAERNVIERRFHLRENWRNDVNWRCVNGVRVFGRRMISLLWFEIWKCVILWTFDSRSVKRWFWNQIWK